MNDEDFAKLIGEVMDELPEKYMSRLDNVAIIYADEPSPAQRQELQLRGYETLFGLYQGVPLPQRGAGYNLVLPDKITLFKLPLLAVSATREQAKIKIKHTLWHEIAHHFGLDHRRIYELEDQQGAAA